MADTEISKTRILQIGMGPLGVRIARFITARLALETVAAVDKNPELIGAEFGAHTLTKVSGISISSSIREAIEYHSPDVAIVTTVSDMERITPLIVEVVSHGIPVISTCEELIFPYELSPEYAVQIDLAARANRVAVLGTGVNPGFLMDTLPVSLTSICQRVDSISVHRFQDAGDRRLPFQRKIGAGLPVTEFEDRVKEQSLRHVGLTESIQMIANRIGWKIDQTEDTVFPVICEKEILTKNLTISPGQVAGVRQVGRGFVDGNAIIELIFQASVGEASSYDEVIIKGEPDLQSRIDGGVNGDVATCAIVLNAIPRVLSASPGLKTMLDIPPVSYFE